MSVRALLFLALSLCATPGPALAQAEGALQKVVVVSRHGVRTPTASADQLALWASSPWPAWNQPAAALTPRGAQLAALMGRWYRDYLGTHGALVATGCPVPASVFVYADVTERTRATARALLDGFAASCELAFGTRGDVPLDPLFHPLSAGVCPLDPKIARARVLERAGGDLERFSRGLRPAYARLQSVLDCCKPALCRSLDRGDQCALADLPTRFSTHADDGGIALEGALPIGSTTSELLLLEYTDGLPMAAVGWGRVTPDALRETLRIHTAHYDLTERTSYLARRKGSALLAKVVAAVTDGHETGFGTADPAVREARFVAYVGHDTNIWNLAGMLDVSWLQPGYQRNQTPPAGALMFEVRTSPDRTPLVYTSYVVQSLEQMRDVTPLAGEAQPLRTALRVPACSTAAPGFPCTMDGFANAIRGVLDRDCVK